MSSTGTILIVDDEQTVRHFFQRALQRDGHQVVTAASGQAALQASAAQAFDMVLLDLRLKDMNGIEVLEQLRQQRPATLVIIITAHGSLETAIKALRQGAHDYLLKPCSVAELRTSVRSGLAKRQQDLERAAVSQPPDAARADSMRGSPSGQDRQRIIQQRGLIIDSVRHVATLDGALLDLSPVEFGILAHLASEAPRVISPEEIARVVQGHDSFPGDARDSIRSHIYHIRTKLKAVTGRDIIRTARGIGYAIDE
jgi:DNA-binding response OmpR family regulator